MGRGVCPVSSAGGYSGIHIEGHSHGWSQGAGGPLFAEMGGLLPLTIFIDSLYMKCTAFSSSGILAANEHGGVFALRPSAHRLSDKSVHDKQHSARRDSG